MSVNILTEDQAKSLAVECGQEAISLFIKRFFPDFPKQVTAEKESDELFTVKQLAAYWQCHTQTIMLKKRKGELPFTQHGRKLLFRKSIIDKLTDNPLPKKCR